MRAAAHFLHKTGYFLFLATLVYAPFAYGCMRDWAVEGLEGLLAASFGTWALGMLLRFRLPRLAWLPLIAFAGELAFGWWMTWNSGAIFDFQWNTFVPAGNPVESLPGSAAANASLEYMMPLTALFAGYCVAGDMAHDPHWRRRLFFTMALTGIALALFGIVLKLSGPSLMLLFWTEHRLLRIGSSIFALYNYHGNAGAYLNLVWPIVLAFAWRTWERTERTVGGQLTGLAWGAGLFLCWAAVLINSSKFALLVFVFLLPVFLILRGRHLVSRLVEQVSWKVLAFYALLPVLLAAVLLFFVSISPYGNSILNLHKLQQGVGTTGTIDDRLLAYVAEQRMLGDAGWHGFGPGTFRVEFPFYTLFLGDRIKGYWYYGHEDYLQTWIEWGWQGCLVWGLLAFGALVRGWWRFPDRANFHSSGDRLLWLGACLSLTGVLVHASIDFPLQIPSLQLYVFTLIAIFWNTPMRQDSAHAA